MDALDLIEVGAGLKKMILTKGTGEDIVTNDKVTVQCTGKLAATDSAGEHKVFWSTRDSGQQPFTFNVGVGQVISGWDQGCLSMKVGEKADLHIASVLGYGKAGFPQWGIPPNANLIFEIEVLSVTKS